MSEKRGARTVLLTPLFLIMTLTFVAGQSAVKGGYYVGGSSSLWPASGLDATLFTHLFFAFANLASNKSNVVISDSDAQEVATFSSAMRRRNPDVLTLISIQASGTEFAVVLQSNQSQLNFINSSISLARLYGFDGVDLDWEFARSQEEMDAFAPFIAQWRQAVMAEGEKTSRPPLLLTAAVYFNAVIMYVGKGSYPIAAIAGNLDFVNVMSYDYNAAAWQGNEIRTGANTNLYDSSSKISTDRGIRSWLEGGMPPDKLVLGLTLYGRSWTLKDQNTANGLGARAIGAGPAQPHSNSAGVFFYSEVVSFIAVNKAIVVHNLTQVTGYCYADNVWVSYEDPFIVGYKVRYAKAQYLRGYFFWQVSQDDNFQVSAAASQAWDTGSLSYTSGPAAAPSSAGGSMVSIWIIFVLMALLISVLLLLGWNSIDSVG